MAAPSVKTKKSVARNSKPTVRMCVLRDNTSMSSLEPVWPVPMRAIGAQNLLTMPGGVSAAGYLHKKGGSQFSLLKWPLRYTIIHKGCVYYFKSSTSATPQGAFSLNGYNRVMRAAEETTSSNVFPFKIVHFSKKHRTWFFSAASEEERRSWMRQLRREIDHYNDRHDSHSTSSDTDSDADSFYGTIEKTMDIKIPIDNTDDDYVEEDDDEDEEDYLKPDSDCSPPHTGRPTGPPPSYPPPPVPSSFLSNQSRVDSKGPPLPPPLHRLPTSPLPKKPPPLPNPPVSSYKGPPPALPFAPHLPRPVHFTSSTPPLPPPNPRRPVPRTPSVDTRPAPTVLRTPPQCPPPDMPSTVCVNGPAHTLSPGNISQKIPPPFKLGPPQTSPSHSPKPIPKSKPPPPISKPPMPLSRSSTSASSLQRASPDGQSFRSSGDEVPVDLRDKWDSAKTNNEDSDDDDYENVQLPDSVFINSTETSYVEKLFKESSYSPEDGLYAIRNSGTKTSKVLVVWDTSLDKARNYRLFEEKGCVYMDKDLTFPSLAILIEHYYNHPLPQHGSLCLQKPYTKAI